MTETVTFEFRSLQRVRIGGRMNQVRGIDLFCIVLVLLIGIGAWMAAA